MQQPDWGISACNGLAGGGHTRCGECIFTELTIQGQMVVLRRGSLGWGLIREVVWGGAGGGSRQRGAQELCCGW